MANICFFNDDFYEIYENEEDCPLKKGYLLVKGEYFLFSVDAFPDDIINLSDNELKNIFYPKYKGNIIFDKYFPPTIFNNFSVFGTARTFTTEQKFKKINKFYSLIYQRKNLAIFYDNKHKKEPSLEQYNKIYKAFFFFDRPTKGPYFLLFLILLFLILLIMSILKHSFFLFLTSIIPIIIIYFRRIWRVFSPQRKINKIFKRKNLNYKLSPK